ncbi:MAG: sugar transferase [Clostridia bacterium]|nr:sugar transferase [Clostridia bacterium]
MKRLFDITVSFIALILLCPLLLLVSLMIFLDDGSPVIFKQSRVGKDNQLFNIYKFRTMKRDTVNVASAELENPDACITKTGRFLRKSSLDELPQLINILKGDMSFVGPRPLIPEESEIRELRAKYNVYSVRPGMTGLAQINGRDTISDEEKAAYDKQYVESRSFFGDIGIIIRTALIVVSGKDIVEGKNDATKK